MHKSCRRVNSTLDGLFANLGRYRISSEMPQRQFPGKAPISQRVAPCFWYCITSWCSHHILMHVHCAAIRTIICKDLAVPYPSSKDYEYQEDYLHQQMKKWVCIHTSKRLSNDRCENRIRSCWATGSLLGKKSLSDLRTWLQGCSLQSHNLNTVNQFQESHVKSPKTQENQLVKR